MEWGKEEEKERVKVGVEDIARGVQLKDGTKGRIISFKANVGGRLKSKVNFLSWKGTV